MSGAGDLSISQETVDLITRGLRAAIDELGVVGNETGALMGSGFDDMSLTKMEAGGGGLADAFEDFCERWEWGVRGLVQDANEIANRLGLAAGMMYEEDQYWADTFAVSLNAVSPTGNPHATEEEIGRQSIGDILTPDAPDYSGESLQQAGEDITGAWQDTGHSLLTEGTGGTRTDATEGLLGIDLTPGEER
ncbi:hypothetical protein [Streptomyces sp. NBC_01803]|uniref:hypothetical protein n=1 Tax=Streptomyces sp. NBC_01803 TaxID=2975946 RepID=UPI002DD7C69B|nr:hypothetical protein [Streptomyces sp. NBC_01803]WSA44082.1 hypothetical protein OIE51_07615 [Streptomyces sp. NBC_01803]